MKRWRRRNRRNSQELRLARGPRAAIEGGREIQSGMMKRPRAERDVAPDKGMRIELPSRGREKCTICLAPHVRQHTLNHSFPGMSAIRCHVLGVVVVVAANVVPTSETQSCKPPRHGRDFLGVVYPPCAVFLCATACCCRTWHL